MHGSTGVNAIEKRCPDRTIFIVAPDGQAGGGMGRVKDYILASPPDRQGRLGFVPLVTRDQRGAIFSLLLMITGMGRMAIAASRGRAAAVHVHMGDRGSILRKGLMIGFARLCGIPALLHLHAVELEEMYARAPAAVRWLIRSPFHWASTVIVLGERYRSWLVGALHVPEGKIDILTNGVPGVAAAPDRGGREGRPCEILFLGNLIERKGVSDLLAALARINDPALSWRAELAGGGDEAHYRQQAQSLGLGERVAFVGWVDQAQVRERLGSADLLVLPSYDEGLPLVILEALGSGLPVVCTPVGSIPEVLTDEQEVLLVPPGDQEALATAIRRLVAEPELRRAMGRRGRAAFDARFSLRAFQDALFAIYRRRCGLDYRPDRSDETT